MLVHFGIASFLKTLGAPRIACSYLNLFLSLVTSVVVTNKLRKAFFGEI